MSTYQVLETDEDSLEFKPFLTTDQEGRPESSPSPRPGNSSRGPPYVRSEGGPSPFWTIEYYQKYFDVDTKTVLWRCYHTLIPREDYVSVVLQSNPDLYGPFWTLTTVIFSLFVFSSLASSISSYLSSTPWDYDFTLLSVAVGIVYAYGMGVPVGLWAILKYLGVSQWVLLDALAVWGYGMTVWIPVALLCIIPSEILRWTCAGIACCLSGFFLVRNLYPVLEMAEAKATRLLVLLIALLHIGVALSFKLIFFSYKIVKSDGSLPLDASARP